MCTHWKIPLFETHLLIQRFCYCYTTVHKMGFELEFLGSVVDVFHIRMLPGAPDHLYLKIIFCRKDCEWRTRTGNIIKLCSKLFTFNFGFCNEEGMNYLSWMILYLGQEGFYIPQKGRGSQMNNNNRIRLFTQVLM